MIVDAPCYGTRFGAGYEHAAHVWTVDRFGSRAFCPGNLSPSATTPDEPASRPADAKGQEPT